VALGGVAAVEVAAAGLDAAGEAGAGVVEDEDEDEDAGVAACGDAGG